MKYYLIDASAFVYAMENTGKTKMDFFQKDCSKKWQKVKLVKSDTEDIQVICHHREMIYVVRDNL